MRVNEEHEVYCPECDTIHVIPPLPSELQPDWYTRTGSWFKRDAKPLSAPEGTEEQAVVEAARALTEVWRALPGAQTVPIDDAMFALVETLTNLDVAALARSTPAPSDGGEACA